jgi:hypothetical protein
MLPASQSQSQPAHWQDPLSRPPTAPCGHRVNPPPTARNLNRCAVLIRQPPSRYVPAADTSASAHFRRSIGAGAGCNRITALGARFWTFCESASLVRRCCSFRQVAGRGGLAVEALRVHVRAGSQAPRISGPRRRGLTGPRLARGKPALSVEPGTPGTWRQPSGAYARNGCHRVSCLALPLVSFLRVRLHAVVGPAARLCQPCTVKPALSEAGVPICTW